MKHFIFSKEDESDYRTIEGKMYELITNCNKNYREMIEREMIQKDLSDIVITDDAHDTLGCIVKNCIGIY